MKVYFDNAATTPLDPVVFETMHTYYMENFGNPSSIHAHGRIARSAIEKARKKIAALLGAAPSEIFFTSGGTESDNMALVGAVQANKIQHVITSPIEHHAVLHTLEVMAVRDQIQLHLVELDHWGNLNFDHLEQLLKAYPSALVSLMHGNNEIGNLNDLVRIGELCGNYGAMLHSDTVQTVGHFPLNLSALNVFSVAGSAHKFHGPKGVGFIYISSDYQIPPFIQGGAQERNMRGGTENVPAIVGMAKALELAIHHQIEHRNHILGLKKAMIRKFREALPDIDFHGNCTDLDNSLYTVLNVSLPHTDDNDMLLFNLDINQISVSAGSACSSGTNIGSHVLSALQADPNRGAIRFSFSKYNHLQEIEYVVDKLTEFVKIKA
ncbi:MAG: cysteine desulfurase family protein [Candidatus Cyclobacteriaceae bacterium M3_2C_046]